MLELIYRTIKRTFIIIGFSAIALLAANPKVMLSFFDSVNVTDPVIHLKDIASIKCESNQLAESVGNLVVGESAPAGFSRYVSTGDLVKYKVISSLKDIDVQQDKCKKILVSTACAEKKVSEYSDLILSYVAQKVFWKSGEYEIEIINPETSWKCLKAPLEVSMEGLSNPCARGMIQLELVSRQNSKVSRIPVTCRINITAPVLVALCDINRGAVINRSDVDLRKVDISRFGPTPFFVAADAIGKKALRTIPAGTVFHERLCSPIPVVTKGDQISISVTRGSVRINVSAIARENGNIGQKIWVENGSTSKLVRVKVKDSHTAELL
jgi:flagella basal body P-ring formation protein FlgA